jgi:hypothetical protein
MSSTHLILIEGVPGSGKTTTAQFVRGWLEQNGFRQRLYQEGDLDHPADYESVACLTYTEYAQLLEKYPSRRSLIDRYATRLRGEYFLPYRKLANQSGDSLPAGLIDDLAHYEIYELPVEKHRRLAAEHWQDFTTWALAGETTFIFECCFMQNPLTVLIARHNLDTADAAGHILRLAETTRPLDPLMIYLDPPDIRRTLEKAAQNRPKEWLDYVTGYITGQAWGAANRRSGESDFDGMVRFYEMRRNLEQDLFVRLPSSWGKLWLDNAGLDWSLTTRQVEEFLETSLGQKE